MASYDKGDIVFLLRVTTDGADCTMADERMRIIRNGTVGIGNPTPQGKLSIGRPDTVSDGTLTI
jgi:hypothetical protein